MQLALRIHPDDAPATNRCPPYRASISGRCAREECCHGACVSTSCHQKMTGFDEKYDSSVVEMQPLTIDHKHGGHGLLYLQSADRALSASR